MMLSGSGAQGFYEEIPLDYAGFEMLMMSFMESYTRKREDVTDAEWLREMLALHLPHLTPDGVTRVVDEIVAMASTLGDLLEDARNSSDSYGWSAETWLYHRIMSQSPDDDDDDFKRELIAGSQGLYSANRWLLETAGYLNELHRDEGEDSGAYGVFSRRKRAAAEDKTKQPVEEEKSRRFIGSMEMGTSFKKSLMTQYQRTMRIDLMSIDTTEVAHNITRNAALSGVGGVAISAGIAALTCLGRRSAAEMGRRQLMMALLKNGTDSGLRTAMTGVLKVGAERNMLPLFSRATPAVALLAAAAIGVESAKIVREYASGKLSGLEAVDRAGRTSVSCVATLGLGTLGASLGSIPAVAALPVVGSLVGGVIGFVGLAVGSAVGKKMGEVSYDSVKQIAFSMTDAACSFLRREEVSEDNLLRQLAAFPRETMEFLSDRW